jgi:anti-sigma-K factor RskA
MNNPRLEEMAALHAVQLLDENATRELLAAAARDPEVERVMHDFDEIAALLALEAPEVQPPAHLRQELMRRLPPRPASSKLIPFSQFIPYAIAACLMFLGIAQAVQISHLKAGLHGLQTAFVAENQRATRLQQSNDLLGLRLATLEAKDPAYAASKIMVAWDPYQHRGIVAMQDLPPPPPGHDYQLWVLDPHAPAPISAGLIASSRPFTVQPVGTDNPGFAISLEPAGGRPSPTGPILFAVAPGQ